jgi:hypothetical protein
MARPRKDGRPPAPQFPPGGRPEKYTHEWLEEEAKNLLAWIKNDSKDKIYIGSFARERGYSIQRISEFEKKSKTFSEAMDEARLWQEEKFLRNGLTKEWDSAQVRYTMARVCGDRWKASWDQPEEKAETQVNITINKI